MEDRVLRIRLQSHQVYGLELVTGLGFMIKGPTKSHPAPPETAWTPSGVV